MQFKLRLLLATALAATTLVSLPSLAQDNKAASQDESEDPPTHSALDRNLFFELMVAEIQAQSHTDKDGPREAFVLFLDAAQKHKDERLFDKATRLALQARSSGAALQAVKAWRRTLPESEKAARFHLEIALNLNRSEEFLEPLQQVLTLTSTENRTELISKIPYALSSLSDKKQARKSLETALAPYLGKPETATATLVALSRMSAITGDFQTAQEMLQKAFARSPADTQAALMAVDLLASGSTAAEALLRQQFQSAGKPQPEVRTAYARALIRINRLADAREQLLLVSSLDRKIPDPYLMLGSIDYELGQLDSAKAHLRQYLALTEDSAEDENDRGRTQAYLALVQVAQKQNKPEEALSWLEQVPNASKVLILQIQRAELLAAQGKADEALALLREFPAQDKASQQRKTLAIVNLLTTQERYREADAYLETARKTDPQNIDLAYEQAMLADKLQQYERMISLLQVVLKAKPDHAHALNALGYHYADSDKNLPEAKGLIEKALSLAPGDPFITDSLGWVEFRMGNFARARELLEKAMSSKADAEIATHLGEVYWAMGDKERARSSFLRARELAPKNNTLLQTLKRLGVSL
ncbi:MAG: hypothetical protein RLZZ271_547 [Pseudomonadota bacterium]